ncbi:MAG TPA: WD40 repeat domain-containing protein, partial [Xanthobacteraceae bacterium]|nr:WD40 repeat domain-containing protein [Xanthobacteraceae bacterium]
MNSETSPAASIVERVTPVSAGGPVLGVHFLGSTAAFVLGEESILLVAADGSAHRARAHAGGILAAAADAEHVATGGDDGNVVLTDARGANRAIASDAKGRWIDRVALGPGKAVAWSIGKTAFVRTAAGDERRLELPSSAGGLAFAPKGMRLAITHYNGASLWFPNASAAPERLEWKGSHLAVTFSPNG